MLDKILLTLDGSQTAEVAIPYAESITAKLRAELNLLYVRPEKDTDINLYKNYLDTVADNIQARLLKGHAPKLRILPHVHAGDTAETILRFVEKNDIDLVIMATRGSSGVKLWLLGSVADKVSHGVDTPILLVRAKGTSPTHFKKKLIDRLLVPLDGSEASKIAVPYATTLAKNLKAGITLFGMAMKASAMMQRLVPAHRKNISREFAGIDTAAEKETRNYILSIEKEIRQQGISASHVVTLGIDPAAEILNVERTSKADIVIMSARGQSASGQWGMGGVAEKILHNGELPLLLIKK